MQIDKDSAQVRFPPPLLLLGALALGWGLQTLWPVTLELGPAGRHAGRILCGAAIGVVLYCNVLFKRAGTNIAPWKPSSALLTTGIYSFTRNPIYLSFVLLCAGIGLLRANAWLLLAAPGLAIALQKLVIAREEAYLEGKFGEEYRRYKSMVRRWI